MYQRAAERMREIGFPRVAERLEAGDVEGARAELNRFKPASFGEAMDLDRAQKAMPDDY